MFQFLNISKQNITVIKGVLIHANAHFITDSSQAWIFSNTKAGEGVCEVFIHYISAANNKKMIIEQPLWKGYFGAEVKDDHTKKLLIDHIDQPILHVVVNIHKDYKKLMGDIVGFVHGVLKKNNSKIGEIVLDTFIYHEIFEMESENI